MRNDKIKELEIPNSEEQKSYTTLMHDMQNIKDRMDTERSEERDRRISKSKDLVALTVFHAGDI